MVPDCGDRHHARGYCRRHYLRWQRNGTPDPLWQSPPICTVEGCDKPSRARGWCGMHYQRWRRAGEERGTT